MQFNRSSHDAATAAQEDAPQLLHEFFERQVARRADHPAIECGGERVTYAELAHLSDRIAMALLRRGLGPGSLIGLYSDKTPRLFAAILGILKAGAAYVPIDPRYPLARIQSILDDAGVKLVLSDGALARSIEAHVAAEVACIADELADEPAQAGVIAPPLAPIAIAPEDACYVIYTSGSTGQPKGVVIEHRNAVNFVHALRSVYKLTHADRVYQGFSVAFDASVEEIWGALSLGGTLVVPDSETARSPFEAAAFINQNAITFFSTVPSFLALVSDALASVKLLVLGGEACTPELVNRWATGGRRLLNTYGPTEATVVATAAACVRGHPVTIGDPLPGYRTYVLDDAMKPVGAGNVGELYIGGDSVARGYLNRPALTAERFIHRQPEDGRAAERLYRTFDLVRVCAGAGLQFVGRADGQIKIRGFRIELAEIEAVLMECPGIRAATVSVIELGTLKELAAYVVLEAGADTLDRARVATLLRERLPEYMVPRYLDVLERFPMMTSGKIDRTLLPAPRALLGPLTSVVVAPDTPLERMLADAFEKEFRVSPISVEADFFRDLHGHSLNAGHVVAELRTHAATRTVSVHDLYAHRTIRQLASHLESAQREAGGGAPAKPPEGAAGPHAGAGGTNAPPWFRFPCAALQLVSLLVYYGITSAPLVAAIVLVNQVRDGQLELFHALDLATTLSFLVWPSWLLLSIAVKWIVIGRFKAGRYRVWGFYYFRWWLVHRFQNLGWSEMFVGSPLMSLYYRAMGARVGRNCTINTSLCCAFDLVSIGDGTSIGSDTHLLGYRVENGWLVLGPVTIGSDCYVGTHCCLGLDTTMNDRARLGDMSNLTDTMEIPAGGAMRGSPAAVSDVALDVPSEAIRPRRGTRFAFGLMHLGLIYVMGYLLIGSILPGLALVAAALHFGGAPLAAAAAFVAPPVCLCCYLALVLIVKWVAIGRILPGVYRIHSRDYLRYWFLNYLLNNTRNIVLPLYATLFLPKFLRCLGARIGANAEISTTMHVMPDLLEVGEGSFLADACIIGTHTVHGGWIALRPNRIGAQSFVGNSALVPGGVDVGSNSLIGVMSTPLPGTAEVPDGTRWLGSPAFELPNTEQVSCFSRKLTFEPGYGLVFLRTCIELGRVLAPSLVAAAYLVLFCMTIAAAYRVVPLWALGPVAAATAFGLSFFTVGVVAAIKVALVDRFEAVVKPLWCSFVWLNEVVNAVYETNAAPAMAPLMGTPLLAICLRMMGCKIGRWVFLESTLFSEFDLVEIGDYAAINLGATIQTHLFEDRVMKADHLKIGEGCTVGNMAVVLYGTEMRRGASLAPLSVLTKGEVLPEHTKWVGIPTRPLEMPARRAAAKPAGSLRTNRKNARVQRSPARHAVARSPMHAGEDERHNAAAAS